MNLKLVKLSEKENAYTYFRDVTKSVYWPESLNQPESGILSLLYEQKWDEDYVNTILSKNNDMFGLLKQGLNCTGYQSLWELLSDDNSSYTTWTNMGRLLRLKSMYELKTGQSDGALTSCSNLLRFGSLITSHAVNTCEFLVGSNLLEGAYEQFQYMIRESSFSEGMLRCCLDDLESVDLNGGLIHALKSQFQEEARLIDDPKSGKNVSGILQNLQHQFVCGDYALHANRTKLAFADFYRNLIHKASCPYADIPEDEEITLTRETPFAPNDTNSHTSWAFL